MVSAAGPSGVYRRTQDARDPTQKVERDVDEQVCPAAALDHDGNEGDEDGNEIENHIGLSRPGGPDSQPLNCLGWKVHTLDEGGPAMVGVLG